MPNKIKIGLWLWGVPPYIYYPKVAGEMADCCLCYSQAAIVMTLILSVLFSL